MDFRIIFAVLALIGAAFFLLATPYTVTWWMGAVAWGLIPVLFFIPPIIKILIDKIKNK